MLGNLELIKKTALFKDLTESQLSEIIKIIDIQTFKKGEIIFNEADPGDAFYIIKSGLVSVKKGEKTIATIYEGSPVGEISFIDKSVHSATVIADVDTETIKISTDEFEKLLEERTDIALTIYKTIAIILCKRLRITDAILSLM